MTPTSCFLIIALAASVLGATAVHGATEHLPAFLLRATAAAAAVAVWPRHTVSLHLRHAIAPAMALVVVAASLPWADNVGLGIQAVLKTGFVVLVFLAALAQPGAARIGLIVFAGVGAVHALWAVGERLAGADRASAGFFSPNDLAAFLAPLFVLALVDATQLEHEPPVHRPIAAAMVSVLGAGLLAAGSRGGLLAASTASLVLLVSGRARRPALAATLALVVAVVTIPSVRARFTGAGDAFAYTRATIWQQAARVAAQEPIGVGLGGFHAAMRRAGVPIDDHVRYPKVAANAHSELLYAAVELGWPGLLAALVALGSVVLVLLRREGQRERRIGDAAVLVALAVPAMVSTSLHVPPVAYLAALWAGSMMARDHRPGPTIALGTKTRAGLATAGGLMLVLAMPGAVASTSLFLSASARDQGDLGRALVHAQRAARFAPWSVGAALMVESLHHARGELPLEIAERLLALAEARPTRVEPVERAARLIEKEAVTTGDPNLWRLAAKSRAMQTERAPLDALAWVAEARAFERAGDHARARAGFARAIQVEPECAVALADLAAGASARGDHERARELARAAHAADSLAPSYKGYARAVLSLDPESRNMLRLLDAGS